MSSVYDWSTTPASNASSDAAMTWAEGQAPSTVNNSARQLVARVAELLGDVDGSLTAGGTSSALTVTANSAFTTYANGRIIAIKASVDNAAAATLNVNGIGAKSIRKFTPTEAALAGGEMKNTGIYLLMYNTALDSAAGGWHLLTPSQDLASFVTLTGSQTLTNKTLTSPTINTPTINTPTVTGGTITSATIASPTITGLDASTTAKGIVELATDAETQTGTDTVRAITPSNLTAKEATAANYRANTADRILTTDIAWSAAAEVTLTDAATIAVDLSTFINANLTLGGNRTLGTPSNQKTGQTGCIRIIQDGTGNRTLAYAANWVFANGTAPTLSTAASKQDLLFYHVVAPTVVVGNLVKAII